MYIYKMIKGNNNEPKLVKDKPLQIEMVLEDKAELFDDYSSTVLLIDNFQMDQLYNEEMYCLAYNDSKELLGCFRISEGSQNECSSDYKKIFTFLLLIGAERFKLYHNHPSNTLNPSIPDVESDMMIMNISDALGIEYSGSYIITSEGFMNIGRSETIKFMTYEECLKEISESEKYYKKKKNYMICACSSEKLIKANV